MIYIDIFDSLSLDDYYLTDLHWRQERLAQVVNIIAEKMGFSTEPSAVNYIQMEKHPFYGAYYGQSALTVEPDSLIYLTNDTIENSVLYNYETRDYCKIYDLHGFDGIDPYDIFLSGTSALITVENPSAESEKELILFRDSFGSSLAPLLLEEYSRITLIDLRFISTDKLDEYIDFGSQDVLFLYSTVILNNIELLK